MTTQDIVVIIQALSNFGQCLYFISIEEDITMYHVLKRDGSTMEFDISKISAAMIKAFEAQNKKYHPSVINLLALQVTSDFESKI